MSSALGYLAPSRPQLLAIGGLSGTGKSTLAGVLAPSLAPPPGAVLLRSDLERKVLFGVDETARLPIQAYTEDVNTNVYAALLRKARLVLEGRHSVVVDAAYLALEKRSAIEAVATESGVPFQGFWLTAPADKLFLRVAMRRNDASDATTDVIRPRRAVTGVDAHRCRRLDRRNSKQRGVGYLRRSRGNAWRHVRNGSSARHQSQTI
jgi:predicted kinase